MAIAGLEPTPPLVHRGALPANFSSAALIDFPTRHTGLTVKLSSLVVAACHRLLVVAERFELP